MKTFNENAWKKTQDAKHIRHSKPKSASSKYNQDCRKLPDRLSYHSSCYSSFNSVPKLTKIIPEPQELVKRPLLRSDISVPLVPASITGVFLHVEVCILCDRPGWVKFGSIYRYVNIWKCETGNSAKRIKKVASAINYDRMLAKIGGVDFHAKEVVYHHSC